MKTKNVLNTLIYNIKTENKPSVINKGVDKLWYNNRVGYCTTGGTMWAIATYINMSKFPKYSVCKEQIAEEYQGCPESIQLCIMKNRGIYG